ncbi:hypothetical protein F4678DRAFT_455848 [Xylaria arbuscula]|nr:hypothetical protein F4678DRAFT_455848 [Xylaria arbuscula]
MISPADPTDRKPNGHDGQRSDSSRFRSNKLHTHHPIQTNHIIFDPQQYHRVESKHTNPTEEASPTKNQPPSRETKAKINSQPRRPKTIGDGSRETAIEYRNIRTTPNHAGHHRHAQAVSRQRGQRHRASVRDRDFRAGASLSFRGSRSGVQPITTTDRSLLVYAALESRIAAIFHLRATALGDSRHSKLQIKSNKPEHTGNRDVADPGFQAHS